MYEQCVNVKPQTLKKPHPGLTHSWPSLVGAVRWLLRGDLRAHQRCQHAEMPCPGGARVAASARLQIARAYLSVSSPARVQSGTLICCQLSNVNKILLSAHARATSSLQYDALIMCALLARNTHARNAQFTACAVSHNYTVRSDAPIAMLHV